MFHRIGQNWKRFEYKHTSISIVVVVMTILLFNTALVTAVLEWFKNAGLLGGFVGGVMSVSMFTTAPAIVLILAVSQHVDTLPLVIVASLGSVVGDWLIIKFLEDEVAAELKPILKKYHILPLIRRLQRSRARWLATTAGAVILALPLPDEFGIGLMDIGKLKRKHLLLICFILNFIGLFALVTIGGTLS